MLRQLSCPSISPCLSISMSEINSAAHCQITLARGQMSQKQSFSNLAEVRGFFLTGSHLNVAVRNKRMRKTDSGWNMKSGKQSI